MIRYKLIIQLLGLPRFIYIMLSIQFCVQHDGFLLELTSAKQEAVLDFYLPEEICWWIGLSDVAQEGKNHKNH